MIEFVSIGRKWECPRAGFKHKSPFLMTKHSNIYVDLQRNGLYGRHVQSTMIWYLHMIYFLTVRLLIILSWVLLKYLCSLLIWDWACVKHVYISYTWKDWNGCLQKSCQNNIHTFYFTQNTFLLQCVNINSMIQQCYVAYYTH